MTDEQTYRALVDVVSGGTPVRAGATFRADEDAAREALAFGLIALAESTAATG